MARLSVCLFGKFQVWADRQPVTGLEAQKAQELFSYLLVYSERPHHREALAELLWDYSDRSKKYLRKALWQVQTAFDDVRQNTDPPVLLVESEWVQFNRRANLWFDVQQFQQTFQQVRGVSGKDLTLDTAQRVKEAVDIYRGDLLQGWYQDWCLFERERLQNMFISLLGKLMVFCETRRQYEEGQEYGLRALAYDRTREYTHRRLMRLFCLAGDRVRALRQYEKCVLILKEDLGVEPAKGTQALYEQIRADILTQPDGSGLPCTDTPGQMGQPQPLGQLRRLSHDLESIQRQLQDVIGHLADHTPPPAP